MNKAVIRGSTRLYGFLLRFYPERYRQEFGEEMQYVFSECLKDAYAERGERGIARYWGSAIVDVGKSLVVQHIEEHKAGDTMKTESNGGILQNSIVRVAMATALLLLIPAVAMFLTDTFNWGLMDFVFTGALLFTAGIAYELVRKKSGNTVYRIAFAVAIATAALLFFSNLALGVIGSEDEPANAMYLGVLAVAVIGAVIARFRPGGMARAMFVTALAQALTIVVALVFVMDNYPAGAALDVFTVNGFFIVLWVVAGLLFRWASESEYRVESEPIA